MSQKVNGAIVIETGVEGRLTYIVEELAFCKRFTMGQLFHAVRNHYGKKVSDYGNLWPKYRIDGEVSNIYRVIDAELDKCANDQEKVQMICRHLGEDELEVVDAAIVVQQMSA